MEKLPLLPLKNVAVFPELIHALIVGRPASLAAVKAAVEDNREVLTVLQKDPNNERPERDGLYDIGTVATVTRIEQRDGGAQVIVRGLRRVRLHGMAKANDSDEETTSYIEVEVEDLSIPTLPEATEERAKASALIRDNLETARRIAHMASPQNAQNADQIFQQMVATIDDPVTQMYRIVVLADNVDQTEKQKILEIDDIQPFLEAIHHLLRQEIAIVEMRRDLESQAREGIEQQQREHVLRHQKRAIEQALGEDDDDEDIAELRKELRNVNLPDDVRKEVDRELKRLSKMSSNAADYQVARSYLELIAELPWNVITEDTLDLDHAQTVLDEDHYGLDDVKERILESLAVLTLNPEAKASILCFVGPPGVGKTSLGQSIARAMGRKFERMSLGGLHDESELRGHRRTYIGAMPGRILQAVRRAGVRNPVLMLDEVDKLGRDFRGDPSAALMEILDPAQNKEFRDNYLNLPFDLSKVFFITTCNHLDGVPPPLLDRMEVLELTGYSELEKLEIARRYLIPRQRENAGLEEEQLDLTDDALSWAIRRHTREAGVRELDRAIGRVASKRARQILQSEATIESITVDDLPTLLGPEKFKTDRQRENLVAGVAPGLAYTETGGDVLYVEATLTHRDDKTIITGHLGQVMQESVKAARSYIWSVAEELNIDRSTIEENGIHVHVPAGAVPKDGPSAGITMATALASLYSNKRVRDDIAMTGELTLSGLILPVGGIREKVLAAHRTGIRHVILPRDNEAELAKLPTPVRDEMTVTLVDRLEDAVKVAIPDLASLPASSKAH
ncbi:MAG: endopeptidase La [Gammaproteobacteria bacterium]|nr:endopeptidase La [Gammaproteobacteria bacterium]MDE0191871.1 endopeptidase La [Gammaproteobacteria bacterium]